jgi:hypothetical protein
MTPGPAAGMTPAAPDASAPRGRAGFPFDSINPNRHRVRSAATQSGKNTDAHTPRGTPTAPSPGGEHPIRDVQGGAAGLHTRWGRGRGLVAD